MQSQLYTEYHEQIIPALKTKLGVSNIHQVPKVVKVVLNTCVKAANDPKAELDEAKKELQSICGQKPSESKAKKSIASFKLREGQAVGAKVTLRGQKMYDFLYRFIRMAIPRIRDFRGISPRGFDGNGNYTFGVTDHTIFPEVELDKIKKSIGLDITIVTNSRKDSDTRALLEALGVPFSDKAKVAAAAKALEAPAEV